MAWINCREKSDVVVRFFLIIFFNLVKKHFRTSQEMKEWEEVDRSYDMWASAIALFEARAQDRSLSRRYERMLEWKERPLSLGHTNEGPAMTDHYNPDPWVDQLLLSWQARLLSFKVPLSATLREALQLLPDGGRPL